MSANQQTFLEQLKRLRATLNAVIPLVENCQLLEDPIVDRFDPIADRFLPKEHQGRGGLQLGDFVIYEASNKR